MSDERKPRDIERDIEQTREKLVEDVEALKDRVSPDHLKGEAVHYLETLSDTASETAREAVVSLTRKAEAAGDRLVERVQSSRFPLAAVGAAFGLGYVLLRSSRRETMVATPPGYTASGETAGAYEEKRGASPLLLAGVALVGGLAVGWMTSGRKTERSYRTPYPSTYTEPALEREASSVPPLAEPSGRVATYESASESPSFDLGATQALSSAKTTTVPSDETFRPHYEATFKASGRDFGYYAHAYRYGALLRESGGHDFSAWEDMEPYARRAWEGANAEPWSDVSLAVRHGWEHQTRSV